MDLRISYKHMESTPSVEEQIQKKAEKLKKFFHGQIQVDWICSVDGDSHSSEVSVHGDQVRFHAAATAENLYKTFDDVVDKLGKQMAKKNDQRKEKIHR